MKELIIVILFVFLTLLFVYLITGTAWRKIDVISRDTAENIIKYFDPDFDADSFRKQVRIILREQHFLNNNRVIFHTPFYVRRSYRPTLNAHTGFPGQKVIFFSPEWAVRLNKEFCLSQDGSGRGTMTDFFIFALGHEMTHKEVRYKPVFLFGKKRICADWLREIFADIGGIKKSNIGTDRIIAAIKTEIPEKYRKHSRKIKGSKPRSHPTWDYRLMCMEKESDINMVFEMVCRDCGVRDIRFSERLRRVFVTAEWKKRNNVVA